ncbi:luciferin 4-monooxygenase-like isoform X2 [Drosophila nasuta]|uniref:luciferin 4-monooxygenase-like isoform X2 n=1 Tax=Drosophila nasuta TaxID=42062 RepID=UPI00295EDD04|nr:luciferin 4-monooxygenase-like isoform X2 [Drosophila nasuta]
MLDLTRRQSTSYNPELKIWSGASEPSSYSNDLTIGEIIFEQLQKDPERIFQISHSEKTTLTRSQILQNASKVGAYLRQEGFIEETDIVAILAKNTTHVASLAYGCMFNGTPFHTVHPDTIDNTICHLLNITKPRIIFCCAEIFNKLKYVADKMNSENKEFETKIVIIDGIVEGVTNILDIFQIQLQLDYKPESFKNGIDRTLAILCSSGTTGTPKAVTFSNSRKIFEFYSYLSESDIQYSPSSLDWVSGLLVLTSAGVYGTLRVISKEVFSVASFLTICEEYKITWTLVPSSYISTLAHSPEINAKQLRTLRYILFGGDRCLSETLKKMQLYLQFEGILHQGYGVTEMGSVVTWNFGPQSKLASVGTLQSKVQMRIVSESGEALGPNERGEIHCHLGQHWGGYYENIPATREIQDSEGWIHTGDLGYFDDDNYLYIVGRKRDFLKFRTKMYYPREIEEVIAQMPEVAEVCVFGIWNEIDGDAAAASVVTKAGCQLTANQVLDFVAENISENYKQLHAGVQIVPNLAKNSNGKVKRQAVKEEFLKASQDKSK